MKVVIIISFLVSVFIGTSYLIGYFLGDFGISLRIFNVILNLMYVILSLGFLFKLCKSVLKKDVDNS